MTGWETGPWDSVEEYRFQDCLAPAGFACLAITAIGLIVAWTGYLKGVRWTWFVMFVIVWGWEFPLRVLPLHLWRHRALIAPTIASALGDRFARIGAETMLSFLLMVIALILPAKTFLTGWRGGPGAARPGGPNGR
jgi:hypothetical protein